MLKLNAFYQTSYSLNMFESKHEVSLPVLITHVLFLFVIGQVEKL